MLGDTPEFQPLQRNIPISRLRTHSISTTLHTFPHTVRGHLQAPTSQTEYVRLTTPDKLCLADTPYIPPHHRRPHLSPLIASPFWPPLTNWAQPRTSTRRYTPRYSTSINILLFVSFVWLPLYCIHPLFHFLLLLFVYNLQLILAEGLILLF